MRKEAQDEATAPDPQLDARLRQLQMTVKTGMQAMIEMDVKIEKEQQQVAVLQGMLEVNRGNA